MKTQKETKRNCYFRGEFFHCKIQVIKIILISSAILFTSPLFANKKSKLSVINLQCEDFKNPLGITQMQPCLSWQLKSDKRNILQFAYRILVSDNLEKLRANQGNLWDSKKNISDQSIRVHYSGKQLQTTRHYYWKVMVWSGKDQASEWSEVASWQMGLFSTDNWSNAKWIGYEDLSDSMRIVPGVHGDGDKLRLKALKKTIVPLFRKEFDIKKTIKSATLYISGLGQYEAYINGSKVSNDFLTPGWTNYDKTIFYNTYDVTSNLKKGNNAIGVIVGNGFYNINRERYRKLVIAYGMPAMICKLEIDYSDHSKKIIESGVDWKVASSPITFTSIYGGEDYDARLKQKGWNEVGFNDVNWRNAILPHIVKGVLKTDPDYSLSVADTIHVKHIQQINKDRYLYDFGQNASGIIQLEIQGEKGQQIKLIPGELLTPQKEIDQDASGTPYYYTYTLNGDGIETWRPKFTYYGFRYVMVENAIPDSMSSKSNLPRIINLKFLHTRNANPQNGTFQCSNKLFNQIFDLINWAIKSNMQSVLTDCPHREKLGWLEQAYLMGNSINYNFNIEHLYSKMVNDMTDAQLTNGLIPDIAPEYVPFEGGFRDSPEWGSASIILPWLIYKWYGNKSVMINTWPTMIKYINYLHKKTTQNILSYGLGDWFDLGLANPGEAQLTPISLTATATYYYDLNLLVKMADLLHKYKEKTQLSMLAAAVKNAFNHKFFNSKTITYATGSQTSMSMPLCLSLVEQQYSDSVFAHLINSIKTNNYALTAGDIGFQYLVHALSNVNASQLLFDMMNREDVPGYGYQLKRGATSLTESWAALGSVSNNHLMLGHIMEWFYSELGGIQQESSSIAYKHIVIKPCIVGNITSAITSFESPYGTIRTEWKKGSNSFNIKIQIPENTTALVYLPEAGNSSVFESGMSIKSSSGISFIKKEKRYLVYKVGSGKFNFEVK
jgi:hypothetical protein